MVSKAIRFFSWGIYSHAAICLPDEGYIIYESWDGVGVRQCKSISDGHKKGTRVDFFSLGVTEDQYIKIVDALRSQLGKKYDYWGVIRFIPFFRAFMGKPSKRTQPAWFCSIYACWALAKGDVYLLNKDAYKISPSDMATSTVIKFFCAKYT